MKRIFTFLFIISFFASSLFAQKDLSILLVHDNDAQASITDSVRHFIDAAGYNYTDYDAVTNGAPSGEALTPYELVIWTTGKDGSTNFWNGELPNDGIKSYLDNGGMLWLEGVDFMYDAFGAAPDTFDVGDFAYDYLGVEKYVAQAHYDDSVYDGVPMMVLEEYNGICTTDTVRWRWSTMWGADAVVPTANAKSIYNMGPADYDFANKSCIVYNEKGDAKILSAFIRWDGFKTYDLGVAVTSEILDYFNQFSTPSIDLTSIEITNDDNNFTISENNGTLQLGVSVLPENATNKTVTWSIKDGSVPASITINGLLTASGMDNGNGIVTVVVTANDGSGISDEAEVTISNQTMGEGFKVLLVNDDARDFTKYLNIDTAIAKTGYSYKIYNAAINGTVPDFDYLSNFNFVIWYNARDGMNLKFWDVTDSTNIKCNSALKKYADNGGIVWLQGRDFLYDIWGSKYTDINSEGDSVIAKYEAGDFVYNYLGIKSYVGQTHSNDGGIGLVQLDIAEENEITDLDPITWTSASSPMYYADAVEVTDNAVPLYYLGPNTYVFSLSYGMVYNTNVNSKFITSTFDPSEINTQSNLNLYIKEVLDYFKGLSTSVSEVSKLGTFELSNYPNPATDKTNITYSLPISGEVMLNVLDITGKVVEHKNLGVKVAGNHTYELNLCNFTEGAYFYQISSGNSHSTNKLIVIK